MRNKKSLPKHRGRHDTTQQPSSVLKIDRQINNTTHTVVSGISNVHGQCEAGVSKSQYRVSRKSTPMSRTLLRTEKLDIWLSSIFSPTPPRMHLPYNFSHKLHIQWFYVVNNRVWIDWLLRGVDEFNVDDARG